MTGKSTRAIQIPNVILPGIGRLRKNFQNAKKLPESVNPVIVKSDRMLNAVRVFSQTFRTTCFVVFDITHNDIPY